MAIHFSLFNHFSCKALLQKLLQVRDFIVLSPEPLCHPVSPVSAPFKLSFVLLLHGSHRLPDLFDLSVRTVTSVLHLLSHRFLSLKLKVGLHSLVGELDSCRVRCPKAWLVAFLDCLGHMT